MTPESDGRRDDWDPDVGPQTGGARPDDTDALDPSGAPRRIAEFGRGRTPAAPLPTTRRYRPPIVPTAPAPPVVDAEFEELPYGPIEGDSPLRNPYFLAAFAVGAAIILAIFVVVLFGGGDGNGHDPGVIVAPLTPGPDRGLLVRSVAAATLREGPGLDYAAISELPRGQEVEVIGKNTDARWFMIYYPPGSSLKGWVPATALNVAANRVDQIPEVDVTPIVRPTVIQPTPEPEPEATNTPEVTATATATAVPGPDLAIGILGNNCMLNIPLVVTVANAGQAPIVAREIRITVSTAAGVQNVTGTTVSLDPGASINIGTNYVLRERTTVTLDLIGAPPDVNPANNAATCAVSTLPEATPTQPVVLPSPIVTLPPTPGH
jgi:hypothetical protein